MSYKLLAETEIDRDVLGYGDSLTIEFDTEQCVLRLSVFEDSHFKEDVCIRLPEYLEVKTKSVIEFLLDTLEEDHLRMRGSMVKLIKDEVGVEI